MTRQINFTGIVATVAAIMVLMPAGTASGQERDGGDARPGRDMARPDAVERSRDGETMRGRRPGGRDRWGRQGGRGGFAMFGGLFEPEFLRRDMVIMVDDLDLDRGQQAIVETLLLDYDASFAEASEAVRDELAALRPDRPEEDDARTEERREIRSQVRETINELRDLRRRQAAGETIDEAKMESLWSRMEEMRSKMDELRPPMPEPEVMDDLMAQMNSVMASWRQERRRIRSGFVGDVNAILNEPQREGWPGVERHLRREKTLRHGRYSGESVDLHLVLRDMNLRPNDLYRFEPTLEEYATSLDRALVARDEFLETQRMQLMNAMRTRDTETAERLAGEESKLRVAVRDVNDRYVDVLEETMVEEMKALFHSAYNARAYAGLYRSNSLPAAFERAKRIEGIDPEVLASIETIEGVYTDQLRGVDEQLIRLTRERDVERTQRWIRRMNERRGGSWRDRESEPDPLRETYQRRAELNKEFRSQLESLLTPAQIEELPEPAEDRGRGGWGGRRGDGRERGGPGGRGGRGERGERGERGGSGERPRRGDRGGNAGETSG